MARFINPTGPTISTGAMLIMGTPDDDMFQFDGAFDSQEKLVVALGGDNTFNGALNATSDKYYAFLRAEEALFYLGMEDVPYYLSGDDIGQIGEADEFKPGMNGEEGDLGVLHGGNYQVPASMWMNQGDQLVVSGTETVEDFVIRRVRPDGDGEGFTANLHYVTVRGNTEDNPFTDDQLGRMVFSNAGHYFNEEGEDVWRATRVDFESLENGPTDEDILRAIDDYLV